MNKNDIQEYLYKCNLDKNKYIVISNAALVLHELKEKTDIIEIACEEKYNNEIKSNEKIKTYNCEYEDKTYINNLPVLKIDEIRKEYLKSKNQQDKKNLELIDKYLNLNPTTLAFLGDSIYEVYIRKYLISVGYIKVDELQKKSVEYVSAKSQSQILNKLINDNYLNQKEIEIIKKGRNTKSHKAPKNTDIVTYKHATGFETLIGYLYLFDKYRLEEIINKIIGD